MSEGNEKPTCPECDTEVVLVENKLPEKCPKCGFLFQGFPMFERWVKAATKRQRKQSQKKDDENESPFAALGRLL